MQLKKMCGLILGCALLMTPLFAQARGDIDTENVHEQYVAKAKRAELTTETRPEYAVANSALDNESVRSNDFTRFVETDERHFLTIYCEEDERAIFGHEECLGLEKGKVYDVEIYIRNDATLCLEHLPDECEKTLRDVKVKAGYPDVLDENKFDYVIVEIATANGQPTRIMDYIEIVGIEPVVLAVDPDSIVIESDGLTNGAVLPSEELFGEEGAEIGYFSLDSGLPAGHDLRVKFKIKTS